MKTLKIIAVLTLVALAAAPLFASAYAYTGGRIGTSATTNSQTSATSYGTYARGMMGDGGSAPVRPQYSSPLTMMNNIFKPITNWMIGFCRGITSRIR